MWKVCELPNYLTLIFNKKPPETEMASYKSYCALRPNGVELEGLCC